MVRAYLTFFQQFSRNVKLFLIGNAINGMGMSIHGLLFNLYLKELGYGETIIGNLISTGSLGISLMAIPAALIIERFHVKQLVVTGMAISSVFYFIQIFHADQGSLFIYGLIAAMFQALFSISVSPFYLRNSTPEQRVHLFSLNSSMNMGAYLIGYALGGYLPAIMKWFNHDFTKLQSMRASIVCALVIVALSNLIFMKIQRVPIPKQKNKRVFEGLREKDWVIIGKLATPKLCLALGSGLTVPFINLYLRERFNFSTKMIGVSYAILQTFIFVGIFITPSLVKKTTNLKFIMGTAFFAIPFMVGMGIAGNVSLVLSFFFMRGMLMNMSSPITSMFEMEKVREKECVFASAIIVFFYHLVYSGGTRLGGYLIETYSFGPTFFMSGAAYAVAIVLYRKFFKAEEKAAVVSAKDTEQAAA
jgi:predicted MFS family arabinose efflux permease